MAELALTVGPVTTAEEYAERLKRIEPFVRRLHLDISDGVFTPTKTIDLAQAYDIGDVPTDLHLMVSNPVKLVEMVISFGPALVICPAETSVNYSELFGQWRELDIKVGLALRHDTPSSKIEHLLADLDHVLIFTGDHMGFNHSHFQAGTLDKVKQIKAANPDIEVGVDGGINPEHARAAVAAGADVVISGGYVVDARDPKVANAEMTIAVSEVNSD